jgi:hypothetical protein
MTVPVLRILSEIEKLFDDWNLDMGPNESDPFVSLSTTGRLHSTTGRFCQLKNMSEAHPGLDIG